MVNWSDPAEIARDAEIFNRFMHACFGLYAWEWFVSLDFDLDFLFGRKKFRWPLIFYFANRYLLLGALCGILIGLDTVKELNCQALYTFIQLGGNASAGLASINLSIRTMAVWQHNRIVDGLLILIILGHWSLILQGVNLTVVWQPGQGCAIVKTNTVILSATWIYSMCFDLTVLLLNMYKLTDLRSRKKGTAELAKSRLAKLLFKDGLNYFIVAFLSNLLATVFMLMNLNAIMDVFFNVPAVIGSTIVACRAVRRLMNFANQGVAVYSEHSSQSTPGFRPPTNGVRNTVVPAPQYKPNGQTKSGIHVQMETFTRAEHTPDHDVTYLRELKPEQFVVGAGRGGPRSPDSDTDMDLDLEAKGVY